MATTLIDVLRKPIKITGSNIDPRYFIDNGDGTYSATPILIHNVARDAAKYFWDMVCKLDTDDEFHRDNPNYDGDTIYEDKLQYGSYKVKYQKQLDELERRKREWRENNRDKCIEYAPATDNGNENEKRYFSGYHPNISMSLNEAMRNYIAACELDNDKSFEASLPKVPNGRLVVINDFKPEYNALIAKWTEELGIPEEPKKPSSVKKYLMTKKTPTLKKEFPADATLAQDYFDGLVEYLSTTTREEHTSKYKELVTFIDGEFLATFDSARHLRIICDTTRNLDGRETTKKIEIYTKATDIDSPEKIITIGKESPSDTNYTVDFRMPGDGRTVSDMQFGMMVSTKADLRKALETVKTMIDPIPSYKIYVDDIDDVISVL